MQSKPNHVFLELLKFPSVELFQLKGKDPIGLFQGPLQVIYSSKLELVLLKLGSNKLSLNASLPVIGAFSGKEKLPAFLIPTFNGFYMIRILDSNPGVVLTNFETILESTCEFYRRSDLEQKLGNIKESKIGVFKEVIQKAKETILPTQEQRHPNYRLIRTYDELLNVDSTSVPVIDISAQDVENIQSETDEVIRNHLSNKHWVDFSHQEGGPVGSYIKAPVLKTLRSTLPPVEQARPRAGSIGADNIASVKTETGFDSQEVVGTENQRLPAYEVEWTKEQVTQGLASCDKEFCPIPKRKTQETEDESLTCDLMRPKGSKECMGQGNEPVPILASTAGRENLEFRPPVSEKERRNIPEQAISKENLPSGQIA